MKGSIPTKLILLWSLQQPTAHLMVILFDLAHALFDVVSSGYLFFLHECKEDATLHGRHPVFPPSRDVALSPAGIVSWKKSHTRHSRRGEALHKQGRMSRLRKKKPMDGQLRGQWQFDGCAVGLGSFSAERGGSMEAARERVG